jgi:hypothetical protein
LLEGWCHSEAYQTNTLSAPKRRTNPDHAAGRQGGGLHVDIELGSAEVARRQESPYVDGQVAFRRPTAASGSVVFTRASGHNGEVTSATVVRIRFATGQPPQILDVRTTPALREREGCRLSAAGPGDAPVRDQALQFQAEHTVVGGQSRQAQLLSPGR